MTESGDTLQAIWTLAQCRTQALGDIELTGVDPVLPSIFKVGAAASAAIAAAALMAAEIWRLRENQRQRVSLAMRAAAAAIRSERYFSVDNGPPPKLWDEIAGFYQTGDSRWVQLHTNFPHHRDGVTRLLQCEPTRAAVADALRAWNAPELEDELARRGMCASFVRTADEWRAHPQARAVAGLPLFEIVKIGASDREIPGHGAQPLSAVRVLDLTRIIAGPVCGRCLASHGADVLNISAAHLPSIAPLVIDTGHGKRSAFLDLRDPEQAERLHALVRECDIFVQGYRPGALAARGFGPEALARERPGIIYVSLSAYSHAGPWAERRGYDSLMQSAIGIAWESGQAAGSDAPKHLPAQVLDHVTGYLAAFAAMVGLARRAHEGGSWLVRVSLAQTGRWFDRLGRIDAIDYPEPDIDAIADLLQTTASPFGVIRHVAPPAKLDKTPANWQHPPAPLGSHEPGWISPRR